jgi:hypothetical protein
MLKKANEWETTKKKNRKGKIKTQHSFTANAIESKRKRLNPLVPC